MILFTRVRLLSSSDPIDSLMRTYDVEEDAEDSDADEDDDFVDALFQEINDLRSTVRPIAPPVSYAR